MRLANELTNLRPQIMAIIDASIDARRDLQATLHVSRVFELEILCLNLSLLYPISYMMRRIRTVDDEN